MQDGRGSCEFHQAVCKSGFSIFGITPATMAAEMSGAASFPASTTNETSHTPTVEPVVKDSAHIAKECTVDKSCDRYVENSINLSLLDPPRFGWTVAGGVGDVLPPHQVRIFADRFVRSSAQIPDLLMCSSALVALRQRDHCGREASLQNALGQKVR
jgi:hypothetical protein